MAVSLINIGTIANDGTGDDLREAFIKVNNNFEELDLRQPEQTTASNLGVLGQSLFAQKSGYDLQFKKIIGGDNITLTANDSNITIDAIGGLQEIRIITDSGTVILEDGDSVRLLGGDQANTYVDPNGDIIINGSTRLDTDPAPRLGASLDGNQQNLNSIGNINAQDITGNIIVANNFQGPLDGLVYGVDIRNINTYFDDFDFGGFSGPITNWIDYLIAQTDIDLGSFASPLDENLDQGFIV